MTTTTTTLAPFRWTRERYEQLALAGTLDGTRCELLDGRIVQRTRPFRWTRDRYEHLATSAVLHDTHVELIDGELMEIEVTISPRHADTVQQVIVVLATVYGLKRVRGQQPLALSDRDEPEPDVMVLVDAPRPPNTHPTSAVLVVEVADSSLTYDRTTKRDRYALAGIPQYWIVNLVDDSVEWFMTPVDGRYQHAGVHRADDRLMLPERLVAVRAGDLFP